MLRVLIFVSLPSVEEVRGGGSYICAGVLGIAAVLIGVEFEEVFLEYTYMISELLALLLGNAGRLSPVLCLGCDLCQEAKHA